VSETFRFVLLLVPLNNLEVRTTTTLLPYAKSQVATSIGSYFRNGQAPDVVDNEVPGPVYGGVEDYHGPAGQTERPHPAYNREGGHIFSHGPTSHWQPSLERRQISPREGDSCPKPATHPQLTHLHERTAFVGTSEKIGICNGFIGVLRVTFDSTCRCERARLKRACFWRPRASVYRASAR
jgi:hypothetical protein